MSLLVVSGDIGGAKAVMPVLETLARQNESFAIVNHGFLAQEAPVSWPRIPAVVQGESGITRSFEKGTYNILLFSASVADTFPLQIARLAKAHNMFVVCLMDSWLDYRCRLEIDAQGLFLPDIYAVIDDLAFNEACADHIPPDILKIVGQPALASLGETYQQWCQKNSNREEAFKKRGLNKDKKLLVFISEPVDLDQGDSCKFAGFRGYTQKTVLREFCRRLQAFANQYQLVIRPHPRENANQLLQLWEEQRGELEGGLMELGTNRETIFLADGVAGMVASLLYEAWLINKPVISLQPEMCRAQLDYLRKKSKGIYFVSTIYQWDAVMRGWLSAVNKKEKNLNFQAEMEYHRQAPQKMADIIKNQLSKRQTEEASV